MAKKCSKCKTEKASVKRPKNGSLVCRTCFFECFEEEIHITITESKLFERGDRVAIGASGGKDSTVLAHIMTTLNSRYDYGLELFLLSIDEGISGYRDDSLETVKRNQEQYQVPLKILSYDELYGWTMDAIVKQIGLNNNCTFCGVFRRQALDRGAAQLKVDKIVTGHNADDIAETVILNMLRGDFSRLIRCVDIMTGGDNPDCESIPRAKPFKYTYEKEIVMYAHFKKLDYFVTECKYSPNAYRGYARDFIKDLEREKPSAILDIINSAESFQADYSKIKPRKKKSRKNESSEPSKPTRGPGKCVRCGYMTSQEFCKACVLLEGLNKGVAKTAIGKGSNRLQESMRDERRNAPGSGHHAPSW